jgi:hypothetical protein
MILWQENPFLEPLEGVGPGNLDCLGPNGIRLSKTHVHKITNVPVVYGT